MSTSEELKINKLAKLNEIEYARQRKLAAGDLGLTVGSLDRLVRRIQIDVKKRLDERAAALAAIKPWNWEVNGAKLLDSLTRAFNRYMVLRPGEAEACALWVVFTHAQDAFDISPRLKIESPERECG